LTTDDAKLFKKIILDDGRMVLIMDKTPLYAESGGQCGDHGSIVDDDGTEYEVYDVQKYDGVFLHFVR
jgi:alanyl-tRNA synthetase